MAVVKKIEGKIKMTQRVAFFALMLSFLIVIAGFIFAYKQIADAKKSIYVLDNGIPVLVKQTDLTLNRPVEYKSQIDLFHSIFFTLTPDEKFIESQVNKMSYLIDDSGMKEYYNLKEKGFYSQILSSNAVMTIQADSILLLDDNKFKYYGKQTINRRTSLIIRNIETEGNLRDVPRSPNNPHGVLLMNWKTTNNSDISVKQKYTY